MKLINRFLALSLTAALFLFAPLAGSITASAAEPRTFQVKYVPELKEWRTQCLPSWDDNRETGDLNYLLYNAVDGDLVVIDATDGPGLDITFPQALGNLTVMGKGGCVIVRSEKPIQTFYAIKGAVASINSEVVDAYIYDDCACNLNMNVKNVYVTGESKMTMNVAALGTVEKCVITDTYKNSSYMYNVQENTLRIENGVNKTDAAKYSTDPAAAPAAPAPAPGNPAPANPSAPLSPATGEGSGALILLAGALLFLAAGLTLRKRNA